MIKTQAIGLGVDDADELVFQCYQLGGIHFAFKDGILHALAVVKAGFGHLAETSFAGLVDGGYIVGEKDIHGGKW